MLLLLLLLLLLPSRPRSSAKNLQHYQQKYILYLEYTAACLNPRSYVGNNSPKGLHST
jgi:hypothetical protein